MSACRLQLAKKSFCSTCKHIYITPRRRRMTVTGCTKLASKPAATTFQPCYTVTVGVRLTRIIVVDLVMSVRSCSDATPKVGNKPPLDSHLKHGYSTVPFTPSVHEPLGMATAACL